MSDIQKFVDGVTVANEVRALRPDFTLAIIGAANLRNGSSDDETDAWLEKAEQETDPAYEAHVAAWHETYRAFGSKPNRFRPSIDALHRRKANGLPRINWAVDAYNAVSVQFGLPIGGEDIDTYVGLPRLVVATGDEKFQTTAMGEPVAEVVDAGEVVWRDDDAVTCRRWNWRQCIRTQLTEETTNAVFLLERLDPYPVSLFDEAVAALAERIASRSSEIVIAKID